MIELSSSAVDRWLNEGGRDLADHSNVDRMARFAAADHSEPAVLGEPAMSSPDAPLEALRRWGDSGAVWRVLSRSEAGVEIALLTCSAGEEVGRLRTDHPGVMAYIGDRDGND